MNQYKIEVNFKKGRLKQPNIQLVQNDYNSTEFIFEFDTTDGINVFKMKNPNKQIYIKDIVDNKIDLVDYNENGTKVSLIDVPGDYEVELTHYDNDGKLTAYKTFYFYVRKEAVSIDDEQIELDDRLPILDGLIEDVSKAINNIDDSSNYAKEQGDYAKTIASEVETKLNNGDFKGEQGIQGIQGEQGIQGVQGEKGEDGYTPIKGQDYFTTEDINHIVNDVVTKLDLPYQQELSSLVDNINGIEV